MAEDTKTAIAEAKAKLHSLENDYQHLAKVNDDKEIELQETIQKHEESLKVSKKTYQLS